MWDTDTSPIEFIQPENIYPSGANHVAVTLDIPANGRLILSVGGPHGGSDGGHVDEREAAGSIIPDTHVTHDLGSDAKRWDNVYAGSGIFGTATVLIGDDVTVAGKPLLPSIHVNTTVYVATTGNDTTGDGSVESPFATLWGAFGYLNDFWISNEILVTISVAAGTYASHPHTVVEHPCAHRIQIVGSTVAVTTYAIIGASTGSKTFTVATDVTSLFTAGSVCGVQASTDNDSSYTVVSSSYSAPNTTVTVTESLRSSTADGKLYDNPSSNTHIIEMAAFSTFLVQFCILNRVEGISLQGHASTPGNGYQLQYGGGIASYQANNSVIGHVYGIYEFYNASMFAYMPMIHGCSHGLDVHHSSSFIAIGGGWSCHNLGRGIYSNTGSIVEFTLAGAGADRQRIAACNNGWMGVQADNSSTVRCEELRAIGNTQQGAYAINNSYIRCSTGQILHNADNGLFVQNSSYIDAQGSFIRFNTNIGLVCADWSFINAFGVTVENNTDGIVCARNAYGYVTSSIFQFNSGTNYSPALDTLGNNNSYITP
jgi:hypothetical protein